MSNQLQFQAINRGRSLALDADDKFWDITDWLDEDGEPCDKEDAVACIAFNEECGLYAAIDLTEFGTGLQ